MKKKCPERPGAKKRRPAKLGPTKCEFCNEYPKQMKDHLAMVHSVGSFYRCPGCGLDTTLKHNAIRHFVFCQELPDVENRDDANAIIDDNEHHFKT
jgi:hypothetical protein